MRKTSHGLGENLLKDIFDKGPLPKIYKTLKTQKNKKMNNLTKKKKKKDKANYRNRHLQERCTDGKQA